MGGGCNPHPMLVKSAGDTLTNAQRRIAEGRLMWRVKESSQGRHAACHMMGLVILSGEKHASPPLHNEKK